MAIFRNVIVPVPKENRVINHEKGVVFHVLEKVYRSDLRYNKDKRCIIGYLNDTDESTMTPNSNYILYYPEEFYNASKNKLAPAIKRVGIYIMVLAISQQWGIYRALVEAAGAENANILMDCAMYYLLSKADDMKDFDVTMRDQLLFGDKLYSDSSIEEPDFVRGGEASELQNRHSNQIGKVGTLSLEEFFKEKVTASHMEEFKHKWIQSCMERGVKGVWLCVDGSISDCHEIKIPPAKEGHSKPPIECNYYSYMYAVDVLDGTPITYRVYRGSRVDRKELNEIIGFLQGYGIVIEGIVLEPSFCTIDCFRFILGTPYKYMVKLKENTNGYQWMYKEYGEQLKQDSSRWVAPHTYAITAKGRVFRKYDEESFITLIYDSESGRERAEYLNEEVVDEAQKMNEQAIKGKASVPDSRYRRFLREVPVGDVTLYDIDHVRLDQEKASKGYSAIACSHNLTSKEITVLYEKRNASEKQYMIMKSQPGFHTNRAHSTEGLEARHLACFVAQIIRLKFSRICSSLHYEPTAAFKELFFLCIQRNAENKYEYFYNASDTQLALMRAVGFEQKDISVITQEENQRANKTGGGQMKSLPLRDIFEKKIQSCPAQAKPEPEKPVEPKQSANKTKKTREKEEAQKATEPKKRGRKRGSKNRPKEVIEAEKAAKAANPERGPGRPKGSKNKPRT